MTIQIDRPAETYEAEAKPAVTHRGASRASKVIGLALTTVLATGGLAFAADNNSDGFDDELFNIVSGFFTGDDDTTTQDPNKTLGTLTFGGTSAARTVGGVALGAGEYGTLYLYQARSGVAEGAWTGVQLSATSDSLATLTFTDADITAAVSGFNSAAETVDAFKNVYEIRLRKSTAAGFTDAYAGGFIKVTGSTWAETTLDLTATGGGTPGGGTPGGGTPGGGTPGGGTPSGGTPSGGTDTIVTPPPPAWAAVKTTFTGAKKGVIASKSQAAAAKLLKTKTTYKNNAKIKGLKIKGVKYNIYEGSKVVGTWQITPHGDIKITKIKLKKTKKVHTLKFQIDYQKAKGKSGKKAKQFAKTKYVAVKKFKTKKY